MGGGSVLLPELAHFQSESQTFYSIQRCLEVKMKKDIDFSFGR